MALWWLAPSLLAHLNFCAVFELIYREPKIKKPAVETDASNEPALQIAASRATGTEPETCVGEMELQAVEMYYPARPRRRVLDGMSWKVPAGKIAALVGPSGGGKSRYTSVADCW